jgi:toxin ParE1/3/4
MSRHVISPRAADDLEEIQDHIAAHNPRAAARLIDAIERRCRLLAQQPMIGRDRSDLLPGMRSVVVDRYLIFYRAISNGIEVVRVLHGARNIDPSLFQP